MISVLIPAYNESERIASTIQSVQKLTGIGEIIVIDDGSTDATTACAEQAGADIVLRQVNKGKGAALQAGYEISRGDIVLCLDADLAETACEAQKLLDAILCGRADMAISNFCSVSGRGGGMGLVVRLARWGIKRLCDRRMETPLSGQRAIRRELIACVGGFASGWGAEVALTISALRLHYHVVEVDTQMTHRVTGRSLGAIRHRAAQFFAVARVLAKLRQNCRVAPNGDNSASGSDNGGKHG